MITIDVQDYCQDCDRFDPAPYIKTMRHDGEIQTADTVIRCRNAERCAYLERRLEDKLKRKICEHYEIND